MNAKAAESSQESVDFIDFYDIWRILVNYKYFLIIFLSIVTVVAVFTVSRMSPIYIATSTLLLNENNENVLSLSNPLDMALSGGDDMIVTEMEVLRSRNMIAQVLKELDMENHPAFKQALQKKGFGQVILQYISPGDSNFTVSLEPESERFRMIGLVNRYLTVKSIPQTRMISVSYEASSPVLARDVANTLADLYIQRHEQIFKDNAEREAKWLEERIEQVNGQLQTLEESLSEFIETNDLVVIDGVSGLSAAKIKQLKVQLLKEQQRNLELFSINTLVKEAGISNLNALLSVDYVSKNPTIQLLRRTEMTAQKKVSELSAVYGSKHPRMVSAKTELNEAQNNLQSELRVMAVNTGTNLATSNSMVSELTGKLEEARKEHQKNQKLENQFIRFTREIDSTRQMYEKLTQQALRNRLTTAAYVGIASVVDPAFAPPFPAKPKKKVIVGMIILLAGAFAVTIILLLESMMNDSFRSASDVTKYLGVPLLGITPKLSKLKRKKLDFAFWEKEQGGFVEAIRTIKTNLLLQFRQDANQKLIAVTSTLADEGKSVVAMNLAFSLSGQGKVLLIDADLRRPSLGERFGLPPGHPGLVELLKGEARFVDCVYRDKQSGMSVLPAGGECDDPLDLLFAPRFHLLLKRLKHHYRYVIIDSVQTEAVSDAFVVAKKADALVYIVKVSSTKREQVISLFERLHSQGINVKGVVATQVDVANKRNRDRFANYYDFKNAIKKQIIKTEKNSA